MNRTIQALCASVALVVGGVAQAHGALLEAEVTVKYASVLCKYSQDLRWSASVVSLFDIQDTQYSENA